MAQLKDITVLITAAGNVYMPGTTRCLRENGERNIRLVGADMNDDPTMLEMFDVYYPVPRGDSPEYVDVLLDICARERVDVILPIMSVELEALAANRKKFEQIGTQVSVSDLVPLRIANNKLSLFDYMVEKGFPCAGYRAVKSADTLYQAALDLGYPDVPVCVKTTSGSGSRGFRILDAKLSKYDILFHQKPTSCYTTLDELMEILRSAESIPEMMVMEYLPGTEYTVDLLADHGKVLYNCCREGLLMENSIMLDGIIVDAKQVLDRCAEVVEALGLDGNIGFDVRERADGTAMIMECNPRITAGIAAFHAAGVNLPYLCIKKLLGEALPAVEPRFGTKMKRRYTEMYC